MFAVSHIEKLTQFIVRERVLKPDHKIERVRRLRAYPLDNCVDLRIRFGLCHGFTSNGSWANALDVTQNENPETVNLVLWL